MATETTATTMPTGPTDATGQADPGEPTTAGTAAGGQPGQPGPAAPPGPFGTPGRNERPWSSRLPAMPDPRRRRRLILGAGALLVVILGVGFIAAGTDGAGTNSADTAAVPMPASEPGTPGEMSTSADSSASAPSPAPGAARADGIAAGAPSTVPGGPGGTGGTGGEPARPAGAQPRIVRNGTATLSVPAGAVDKAVQDLSAAARGLAGYTESSEVSGTPSTTDDGSQYATVTLRVPSESFDELRSGLSRIGTVSASTMSSRDVTGEYVDLEARKRALEASRTAYTTLLSNATTVGETLSVQQAIDGVQIQIEQIEGQRMVLADASDLATLTVQIAEDGADPAPGPDDDDSGLVAAARTSWNRFVRGIEEIIALLGPLALVGLVAACVYGAVRIARRWGWIPTTPAPPAPPRDSAGS
ncbi:DUF4349 domain-containing protein [Parafrankia sp. BMG5.11]|uniref:DUF4349 domain-containing protein n=1 Tax=Parafrankia sp. BMG5.11 TaxID=222540 RepID=UPI001FB341F6|nr:DUF4349 domain-containing protein [Parafrankia sp. BMG5.11]